MTPRSAIKVGDTAICWINEWGRSKEAFDCSVIAKDYRRGGVEVCYLSGYRSRNDFVPWADVVAKVDSRRKTVKVVNGAFEGSFLVFPNHPFSTS